MLTMMTLTWMKMTDILYSEVVTKFQLVSDDSVVLLNGTCRFSPQVDKVVLDDGTTMYLSDISMDIYNGEVKNKNGAATTLPAHSSGIGWNVYATFTTFPFHDEFVVESYPGTKIFLGD